LSKTAVGGRIEGKAPRKKKATRFRKKFKNKRAQGRARGEGSA